VPISSRNKTLGKSKGKPERREDRETPGRGEEKAKKKLFGLPIFVFSASLCLLGVHPLFSSATC
jgi:hypothetical protein